MKFKWWHGVLILALFLALLSPLASSSPDGLERVAEDKGFMETAREAVFEIIPDYVLPGVGNEAGATILAGIIGTLMLFGIGYGLAQLLKAKR
ncbi:MAG: PDGLE domain-containing protein [Dehalococcoidales bacterium]|nr:PDGLE domain-containing protein [Dehalococcoidales bacterium]